MQILFRADAGKEMGTGHVMRCLALAEVLREGGHGCSFLSRGLPQALRLRIEREGCDVLDIKGKDDAGETLDHARNAHAGWIVADGYQFDARYQQDLRKGGGAKILFLDDFGHATRYAADLVLNQNVYAHEDLYSSRDPHSRVLLGPRFALLRREFRLFQGWKRTVSDHAKKVLLTFGGSDPKNATGTVLQVLQGLKRPLDVTVVVGSGNPHSAAIDAMAKNMQNVRVLRDVQDMPRLMQEADAALCGGGTTCYEMAFLQLPMLTIVLAENQRENAAALERAGCSFNAGALEEIETADLIDHLDRLFADGAARASMADRGGLLVDGEGAERVAMKLTGDRVRLRRARPGDCERVFVWANDPDTRKASFSSAPIPWEDHAAWFHKSLHNPNRLFFIAVDEEDRPAGFIRFDAENRDAVLSIAVAPEARGAGFGSELVLLGTKKLFDAAGCDAIHAYVKPDNAPSARLFQKTGFTELAETTVSGNRARHFVLKRGIIGA